MQGYLIALHVDHAAELVANNGRKLPAMTRAEAVELLKSLTTILHAVTDRLAGLEAEALEPIKEATPHTDAVLLT